MGLQCIWWRDQFHIGQCLERQLKCATPHCSWLLSTVSLSINCSIQQQKMLLSRKKCSFLYICRDIFFLYFSLAFLHGMTKYGKLKFLPIPELLISANALRSYMCTWLYIYMHVKNVKGLLEVYKFTFKYLLYSYLEY